MSDLMHPLDDMSSTLYHLKQIERRREPEVSEHECGASPAKPMKLVADKGEYYGLGHTIVEITE